MSQSNPYRHRALPGSRWLDCTNGYQLASAGVPRAIQCHEPQWWPSLGNDPEARGQTPPDLTHLTSFAAAATGPVFLDADHVNWETQGRLPVEAADGRSAITNDAYANEWDAGMQRYIDTLVGVLLAVRGATPHPVFCYNLVAPRFHPPRQYVHGWITRKFVWPDAMTAYRMQWDRLADGTVVPGRLPRLIDAIHVGHYYDVGYAAHMPQYADDPKRAWQASLDMQAALARSWRKPFVGFVWADAVGDEMDVVWRRRRAARWVVFGPGTRNTGPLVDRIKGVA